MLGRCVNESLWFSVVGMIESLLTLLDNCIRRTVMEHLWRLQGCSTEMMATIIPREENLAKGSFVLDRAEPAWELESILEGLEHRHKTISLVLDSSGLPRKIVSLDLLNV